MVDAQTRILYYARKGVSGAYTTLEAYAHFYVNLRALARLPLAESVQEAISHLLSAVVEADTRSLLAICPDALRKFRAFAEDELAAVVAMFAHTIEELEDEPSEESHCHFAVAPIECEQCREQSEHFLWTHINTHSREDLKTACAKGQLFELVCPFCGHDLAVLPRFVYCDPSRDDYLIFGVPYNDGTFCKDFHKNVQEYFDALPPPFRNDKTQVAFVSRYIKAPWKNADEVNLVSHVENPKEFVEIITARIWEMCVKSPKLMQHPQFMFVGSYFDDGEFGKAIGLWATSFLIDPKQHGILRDMAAALTELGDEQKAGYLVNEAARLREQLKKVGVIFETRDGWPVPDSQNVMKWFMQIETDGLPDDWGFLPLLNCVQDLKQQYLGVAGNQDA